MIQVKDIFSIRSRTEFEQAALEIFRFQAEACPIYRDYLRTLGVEYTSIDRVEKIPFLPIEFFKSHRVYSVDSDPQQVFSSSTTTGMTPAQHYVADLAIYERSFTEGFRLFYGDPEEVAIFALLPNYLEREGSSLIYMVDRLIAAGKDSTSQCGGFYLYDQDALLRDMAKCGRPKILLGVSYALWDLAEQHPGKLDNTIVMETGGMKGHREELPREEFHRILCEAFGVTQIHSEYGMAELLSQAYSQGEGMFGTPSWMRIMIRDLNDPFLTLFPGQTGDINIIDLANIYSCSFIQTQDLGIAYPSGKFRVLGRIDHSEIRGCNLLVQDL